MKTSYYQYKKNTTILKLNAIHGDKDIHYYLYILYIQILTVFPL